MAAPIDERDRDERRRLADAPCLDDVVEEEAGERGRDRRRDQQPGQPAVRVAAERAVADGREAGRDEPEPVGPEVDEQGQQRARRGASR